MARHGQIAYMNTFPRQNENPHDHKFWKNIQTIVDITRIMAQKISCKLDYYFESYEFLNGKKN
jgi:hypothetical protein